MYILFLLWACSFSSISEIDKPPQRNVILIVADTLRADRIGAYGNTQNNVTPNIDKLAQTGLLFEQSYSQSGWTLPSFASLFTGLYPFEHRVVRSSVNKEVFGMLSKKTSTLATLFRENGYQTTAFVNNTFLAPQFGLNAGFEDYSYHGADNYKLRTAKKTTDLAVNWLKEQSQNKDTQNPFFMVVHYMEPHMNLAPSDDVKGMFSKDNKIIQPPFTEIDSNTWSLEAKRNEHPNMVQEVLHIYDEEIYSVDLAIGNLLQGLDEVGRREDTLIVFTSDHGEEYWEHGGFGHGHNLYGVLTKVPLIVNGPTLEGLGTREFLVEHVDVFHSILSYVGITPPEKSRGQDIFSMARKGESLDRWIYSENTLYGDPMIAVTTKSHRLLLNQKNKTATLWNTKNGFNTEPVPNEQQTIQSQPLLRAIKVVRGNIEPIKDLEEVIIPGREMFQQLRALGYIEE